MPGTKLCDQVRCDFDRHQPNLARSQQMSARRPNLDRRRLSLGRHRLNLKHIRPKVGLLRLSLAEVGQIWGRLDRMWPEHRRASGRCHGIGACGGGGGGVVWSGISRKQCVILRTAWLRAGVCARMLRTHTHTHIDAVQTASACTRQLFPGSQASLPMASARVAMLAARMHHNPRFLQRCVATVRLVW